MKFSKFFFLFSFLVLSQIIQAHSIEIKDKTYRTIMCLPFRNQTKNEAFNYLGDSLQTLILDDLKSLKYIYLSTKDILKPKINTNYTYSSNFRRKLVVIESLTNTKKVRNLSTFCSNHEIDYIIKGYYSVQNKNMWRFHLELYNAVQKQIIYETNFIKTQKKILASIPQFTMGLKKILNKKQGRNVTIKIKQSFTMVFQNADFVGYTPITIFLTQKTNHLSFQKKNYITKQTNLILSDTLPPEFFITLNTNRPEKKISIKTKPNNAKIYIDENFVGFSPVSYYPQEKSFLLTVSKSNYKNIIRKITLTKNKNFFLTLKSTNQTKPFLSNTKWSWIMFSLATACLGYSIYNGMQYEYYHRLYNLNFIPQNEILANTYYDRFGFGLLGSMPFFGGVLYFNIKSNNEKDW